jgi:hypothetical protein
MPAIDRRCLPMAFEVAKNLNSQSLAFDFLYNQDGKPQIGEISYTFVAYMVYDCPGYWDEAMNWHEGHFWPQDLVLQDMIDEVTHLKESR